MDTNMNSNSVQGGESVIHGVDWRTQMQPDTRRHIVDWIMGTLKDHLPLSSQDGLLELHKIAERIEENIYSAATNQSDYFRKISLKMLPMENKSQTMLSNSGGTYNRAPNPDSPSECITININGERRVTQDLSSIPVILLVFGEWVKEGQNFNLMDPLPEMLLLSANETYLGLLDKLDSILKSIADDPDEEERYHLCIETSYVYRGVSLRPTKITDDAKLKAFIAHILTLPAQERIPLCVSFA